jgi:hypothetical protein
MAYTYLVINKITGMFYYGARYSARALPEDLWNTYYTSSKLVKNDIATYGKDAFYFEVRKTFGTVEECLRWEYRVLVRIKAKQRLDCYNLTNGGAIFNSSKQMRMQNPMRDERSVSKMVETKKKLRVAGLHKSVAPNTKQGLRVLSEKMMADKNPMKDPAVAAKMAKTRKDMGTTSAGTKWIRCPTTGQRKRVKIEVLQEFIDNGWLLGAKCTCTSE